MGSGTVMLKDGATDRLQEGWQFSRQDVSEVLLTGYCIGDTYEERVFMKCNSVPHQHGVGRAGVRLFSSSEKNDEEKNFFLRKKRCVPTQHSSVVAPGTIAASDVDGAQSKKVVAMNSELRALSAEISGEPYLKTSFDVLPFSTVVQMWWMSFYELSTPYGAGAFLSFRSCDVAHRTPHDDDV